MKLRTRYPTLVSRQLVVLVSFLVVLLCAHHKKEVVALSSISIPSPSSTTPLHNFGPASTRDNVLFTAERPGNPEKKTSKVSDDKVRDWISYVKGKGISTVVALLDENEITNYEPSGLLNLYREGGLQAYIQPMSDPVASKNIFNYIRNAESTNTGIVTHCTGGIGRCGRVAGAWLVHRYNLTPQQASEETLNCAQQYNIHRACDPDLLEEWLLKNRE